MEQPSRRRRAKGDKMTKTTNYHYFHGTARFVRTNKADQYGNYTCKLEMDEDTLADFNKTGIQLNVNEDNSVFFKRPHQKIFGNELTVLGAPKVVDADGKDFAEMVGNGSKVVVKVKSFNTMKGKGHTLEAIQVLEYVKPETSSTFYNF